MLPANGSHGLCWTHAPENAAKRRRNASKAATAKADKELRETKAEIRELVRMVRSCAWCAKRTSMSARPMP
jgi:acyl-CoA reductase-like NAD-dependent aldehyde dehydrogenase